MIQHILLPYLSILKLWSTDFASYLAWKRGWDRKLDFPFLKYCLCEVFDTFFTLSLRENPAPPNLNLNNIIREYYFGIFLGKSGNLKSNLVISVHVNSGRILFCVVLE